MTGPQNFALLALAGSAVLYFLRYVSYNARSKGAKFPPGPKGIPFLGNIADMDGANLIPVFNKWHKKYGPVVGFEILGSKQVVLNTEKAAQDLFVKRGNIYSGRGIPPAAKAVGQHVTALLPRNDRWRRQRKALHALLSGAVVQKYEPLIGMESTYTIASLLQTPLDFDTHLVTFSWRLISRLGFNIPTTQGEIDKSDARTDALLDMFRPDLFPANLLPFLIHFPRWLIRSNARIDKVIQEGEERMRKLEAHVQKELKEGSAPPSWMRYLLEHQDELQLSPTDIDGILDGIIGGGQRSPYNALMSFIIAMMEHPIWLRKIQEELDRVVGSKRLPTFDDLPQLPVVRAVVLEGLRWRSIVAEIGVPHQCDEDDFYEGYFIPKGTILHANYSSILADPTLYPDGPVFNPDRWLNPSFPTYKEPLTEHPNMKNFTSFGYGRRACPGAEFTSRALNLLVARIAWACDIRKCRKPNPGGEGEGEEEELRIEYEPTPNPRPLPFKADIRPRDAGRIELVQREAMKAREIDPMEKGG